ncbi:unnamed protein product [Fusarium graminearum]|nr:unnamed protein product [Fusarium graminearum]
MDSPDDAPYFCMADTRCRLCHFDLKENDRVIAHVGDRRCSMAFNLRMTDTIHDRYEWINLHTCARRRCMMDSPRVPFFHRDCYRFRLYHISDALAAAGNYTFDPPGHEENRRSHRIKRLLVPKLRDQLQIRLPDEILVFIAGHLVRKCAAITTEEQSLGTDVSETTVSLIQDVYISCTVVDGVRYVKSLDNAVPKLCEQDRPTLLSKQGEPIRKIWIAEDYRGIRAVKLCSADASFAGPTPIVKSWWRAISVPYGIENITIKSDASTIYTTGNDTDNYVGWSNPEHPNDVIDITTFDRVNSFPERLRMSFFNCNADGTTGYTVVTSGASVSMIHAHENDDIGFYEDMDYAYPRDFFIYMPLDNGEFVTEICRRYARAGGNLISACLVFITNKGRSTLFGTSGPPESCLALDRILTPAPDGTQIWFNDSKSLRYLAVDGLGPPIRRSFPPSLMPNSPYFWRHNMESWFVSSCSMEGIVDMTLCRDMAHAHRPIAGILLEYENGHRECLGQFRFDKALEKVRLEHATDIYIGSSRTARSHLYVAHIGTSPLQDSEGLWWMRISLHGMLEWWSSFWHSIMRYTSATGQFTNLEKRS